MSSRLVGWAINDLPKLYPELSQGARHLFTLLADHFNEAEGAAWPSHDRLAFIMGCDRRSVIRWMKELKEAGLVNQTMRTNNSNIYRLVCDNLSQRVTQSHRVGDTKSPVGVTQSHTNSYITLKEPEQPCGNCDNGWIETLDEKGYGIVKKCPNGCRTAGTHAETK